MKRDYSGILVPVLALAAIMALGALIGYPGRPATSEHLYANSTDECPPCGTYYRMESGLWRAAQVGDPVGRIVVVRYGE